MISHFNARQHQRYAVAASFVVLHGALRVCEQSLFPVCLGDESRIAARRVSVAHRFPVAAVRRIVFSAANGSLRADELVRQFRNVCERASKSVTCRQLIATLLEVEVRRTFRAFAVDGLAIKLRGIETRTLQSLASPWGPGVIEASVEVEAGNAN